MANSSKSYRASLNVPRRFISSAFARHSRLSVQPRTEIPQQLPAEVPTSTLLDVPNLLNEPVPEAPDSSYFSSTNAFPSFPTHYDDPADDEWDVKRHRDKSASNSFARFRFKAGYDDSDTEDEYSLPSEKALQLDKLHTKAGRKASHSYNLSSDMPVTPERPPPKRLNKTHSSRHSVAADLQSQGWDEETLSRTPAKRDNDKWLESLGFDISLLKIASPEKDEIENKDPNSSKYISDSPKLSTKRRPMSMSITFESPPPRSRARPSLAPVSVQSPSVARTPRRTLDIPVGSEQSRKPLVSSADVRSISTRKSSRMSARVSRREMKAIMEGQGGSRAEKAANADRPRLQAMGSSSIAPSCTPRAYRKSDLTEGSFNSVDGKAAAAGGSEVVLTPVRASKQQRKALGSDCVVTPVRRSLRNSYRKMAAVNVSKALDERRAPLESADYAYVPNDTLKGSTARQRQ